MNLQQFSALKPGDKIVNGMNGSRGEIASATDRGVNVRWRGTGVDYFFSVMSTAWMHWSKEDAGAPEAGTSL